MRQSRRTALGRLALLAAGLGEFLVFPSAWAQPSPKAISDPKKELDQLLAAFRKVVGISADFEEEKRISLLKTPLMSSGQVYFHPPSSLARVVKKPRPSHLVLSGRKIVVKEEGVKKEVDLSDKPALRALVNSLLHVLSGNRAALASDYDLTFEGHAHGDWSLRMKPKNADLKSLVTSFAFRGNGIVLSELRIVEASGDETISRFSNVDTARKFTAEEITRFFDI